jgi:CubicO group peptidase (beta-lactamase class C family)
MVRQLVRATLFFWSAVAPSFATARAQQPLPIAPDSARRALAEYARRAAALGVSGVVLVASGDEVLLHRAMGWRDPSRRAPNDTSTLFYIASMAKQFVAAAVLRLEADGRLHTSDSLAMFFPSATVEKRAITVDQLLSHMSGLGRYGWDPLRRDWAVEDREQAVRGILRSALAHTPGSEFDYQNSNYLLLAAIIEHVAGMPFGEFIEQRLLRPAGMRDTYFYLHPTNALRGRVAWSLGDEAESFSILNRERSFLQFYRGVVSTAADLYRWLRALDRGDLLPETARRKLFDIRALLGTNYGYAAGWFVRTDSAGAPRVVFHGGDFGSYHSEIRLAPISGRILIAMTNVSFGGRSITESLLNQMTEVMRGLPDPLPDLASPSEAGSAALAGEYVSETGDRLFVEPQNGSLIVAPSGQRAIDWLTSGDTAMWRERQIAGESTLAIVDWLRGVEPAKSAPVRSLPPAVSIELADEWAGFVRHGGLLKSFQFLGTTRDRNRGGSVGIVRLKFQRDSLLYGVAWSNGALAYTAPGIPHFVAPRVFALGPAGDWVSWDWTSESVRRARFAGYSGGGGHATLILETANGPMTFVRR